MNIQPECTVCLLLVTNSARAWGCNCEQGHHMPLPLGSWQVHLKAPRLTLFHVWNDCCPAVLISACWNLSILQSPVSSLLCLKLVLRNPGQKSCLLQLSCSLCFSSCITDTGGFSSLSPSHTGLQGRGRAYVCLSLPQYLAWMQLNMQYVLAEYVPKLMGIYLNFLNVFWLCVTCSLLILKV